MTHTQQWNTNTHNSQFSYFDFKFGKFILSNSKWESVSKSSCFPFYIEICHIELESSVNRSSFLLGHFLVVYLETEWVSFEQKSENSFFINHLVFELFAIFAVACNPFYTLRLWPFSAIIISFNHLNWFDWTGNLQNQFQLFFLDFVRSWNQIIIWII